MNKSRLVRSFCTLVLLFAVSVSQAGVVALTEVTDFGVTFSGYSEVEFLSSDFFGNLYDINVKSAVYSDGGGNYVYLYQITNGDASAALHRFTMADFAGLSDSSEMGYITGGQPSGFVSGDVQPISGDVTGLTGGFNFSPTAGGGIESGELSVVLYIKSSLSQTEINGQVIDGGVAFGSVLGALIPEPATVALLVLGSLTLRIRKK